jgi:hypothetical protein
MKTLPKPKLADQPDPWPDTRPLPWVIDLCEWLRYRGYPLADRQRILSSLIDYGSFAHSAENGLLDPEDYPLAEAIYCESQPVIPYDDPAWLNSDLWQVGPEPRPAEPTASRSDWQKLREEIGLIEPPAISGGAPVTEVFERCALAAEKIIRLQAELDAIPTDWRDNYYPY